MSGDGSDGRGAKPPRTLFSLGRPGSKRDRSEAPTLVSAPVETPSEILPEQAGGPEDVPPVDQVDDDEIQLACGACGALLEPSAASCGSCGTPVALDYVDDQVQDFTGEIVSGQEPVLDEPSPPPPPGDVVPGQEGTAPDLVATTVTAPAPPGPEPVAGDVVPGQEPVAGDVVPGQEPVAGDVVPGQEPVAGDVVPGQEPVAGDVVPGQEPVAGDVVPGQEPVAGDVLPGQEPVGDGPDREPAPTGPVLGAAAGAAGGALAGAALAGADPAAADPAASRDTVDWAESHTVDLGAPAPAGEAYAAPDVPGPPAPADGTGGATAPKVGAAAAAGAGAATAASDGPPTGYEGSTAEHMPYGSGPLESSQRSNAGLIVAAVAVVAVLLIGGVAFALTRGSGDTTATSPSTSATVRPSTTAADSGRTTTSTTTATSTTAPTSTEAPTTTAPPSTDAPTSAPTTATTARPVTTQAPQPTQPTTPPTTPPPTPANIVVLGDLPAVATRGDVVDLSFQNTGGTAGEVRCQPRLTGVQANPSNVTVQPGGVASVSITLGAQENATEPVLTCYGPGFLAKTWTTALRNR